jgi:hypothetical protein
MAQSYKKADVKNIKPGYKNKAYIAAQSWFTTLAEPDPAGTGAAKFKIEDDHTFPTGKGFIEVTLVKKKNTHTSEQKGDPGASWLNHKVSVAVPGEGPELLALVTELMNEDLVILMQDSNCPGTTIIQLGCDCDPGGMGATKFDGGLEGGDAGKGYSFDVETTCKYFYEGTITMQT